MIPLKTLSDLQITENGIRIECEDIEKMLLGSDLISEQDARPYKSETFLTGVNLTSLSTSSLKSQRCINTYDIIANEITDPRIDELVMSHEIVRVIIPTTQLPQVIIGRNKAEMLSLINTSRETYLNTRPLRRRLFKKGVDFTRDLNVSNESLNKLICISSYGWSYVSERDALKTWSPVKKFKPAQDKVVNKHSGFRVISKEETLKNIEVVADPIFGCLCFHGKINNCTNKGGSKTYFSTFCEHPIDSDCISNESLYYTAMGKGIDDKQSKVSSLCEAIERISSNFDDSINAIEAKQSELENCLKLVELTPFSQAQYKKFAQRIAQGTQSIYEVEEYLDQPIHWTKCRDLFDQEYWVPINFVYKNTPYPSRFVKFYHNGGAAGNSLEEAILQGTLELIERDAVAIWWYNKTTVPRLNLDGIGDELTNQIELFFGQKYNLWLLDLTSDIGIPVVAAISLNAENSEITLSFGCHLDLTIAKQRAITELFQVHEIKDINTSPFSFSDIRLESYILGSSEIKSSETSPQYNFKSISDSLNFIVSELKRIGVNLYYVDQSKDNLPLYAVKVIAPNLCHFFPYLGSERLYTIPVKMGLLEKARNESELNKLELLI
ncbi:YcaO-like family protein [Pseudoalteromonas rubra]|uniref:YcaO-like family protein n=1 Tax=Pseudoalteromonas rubra TaxID=43658 RepID=UPI002DBCA3DC|nr:YcaO-like family protein [Pseudoalteromonas rubra]MEC4090825.1 YcaO-like family protein [Pseudoalteromonas rubra]